MPWTVYTDEELWKANVKLAKFRKWAKANPDVLRWMFHRVRWQVEVGRRTSAKRLFEQARYDSGIRIVDVDGEVKVKNDFAPFVARILIKSIPEAKSMFVTKKSVFDLLDDSQVPHFDMRGTLVWDDAA